MQQKNKWEHFPHDADIGVRGYGETVTKAFEMAALALTAIVTDPTKINPSTDVTVVCNAPDIELLFVDWLNVIIYEMDVRGFLFSKFKITLDNSIPENLQLNATLSGEAINKEKHELAVDVKGATYTALKVFQQDDCWIAQCVVDV